MLETQMECVLVIPTPVFLALGHFQGFRGEADHYLAELLKPEHISYRPRSEMEVDPSFKQLIPYCIFCHRDAGGRVTLFQYRRGQGQGEGRLHAKRSIGVGGHISADDGATHPSADPYQEGLRRELAEEVSIETSYRQRRVGIINDDQTEVGRVHLGIVHLFEVDEPAVFPREADLLEAGFCPLDELLAQQDAFETWSQICLTNLF
jgi:predicted NUDIX family phosphoesterase